MGKRIEAARRELAKFRNERGDIVRARREARKEQKLRLIKEREKIRTDRKLAIERARTQRKVALARNRPTFTQRQTQFRRKMERRGRGVNITRAGGVPRRKKKKKRYSQPKETYDDGYDIAGGFDWGI